MNGGTYADYLATVRTQEARDRDRFMGHDSHADEPMYRADDGARVGGVTIAELEAWLAEIGRRAEEVIRALVEAWKAIEPELQKALGVIYGEPTASHPLGIFHVTTAPRQTLAAPRHSYPKPRREWWNR